MPPNGLRITLGFRESGEMEVFSYFHYKESVNPLLENGFAFAAAAWYDKQKNSESEAMLWTRYIFNF